MTTSRLIVCIALSAAFSIATCELAMAADATAPVVGFVPGWQERQDLLTDRVKKASGHVDLVFIGDSITHNWEGNSELWQKYYGRRNAANLGIGGDRTQQVLWRLDHGNTDDISPKLAVVMIGTNNSCENTPEQTADGVKAIVAMLRRKLPNTHILMLAIFPRGTDNNDHPRQVNARVNEIIGCEYANTKDKAITYMDIGQKFLAADGTLSKDIMYDLLHLTSKGYTIWAEAIEPVVAKWVDGK